MANLTCVQLIPLILRILFIILRYQIFSMLVSVWQAPFSSHEITKEHLPNLIRLSHLQIVFGFMKNKDNLILFSKYIMLC